MKNKKGKQPVKKGIPVWGWVLLAVGLLAIAGVLVLALGRPKHAASTYPAEITPAQAAEKADQGAFILDVRQPDEWAVVHIPGATLIPLGELPNRLNEVPKDREVVVVCHSGNRSAQGRDILWAAGFTQVTSMAGGMTAWQAQNLPVASGQ